MIILIRLFLLHDIPAQLTQILTDERVVKTGAGIKNDVALIEKQLNIKCRGFVELNHVIQNHEESQQIRLNYLNKQLRNTRSAITTQQKMNTILRANLGLKTIVELFLNQKMQYKDVIVSNEEPSRKRRKTMRLQFHSKWKQDKLTKTHVLYGADDALKSYRCLLALISMIGAGESSVVVKHVMDLDAPHTDQTKNKERARARARALETLSSGGKSEHDPIVLPEETAVDEFYEYVRNNKLGKPEIVFEEGKQDSNGKPENWIAVVRVNGVASKQVARRKKIAKLQACQEVLRKLKQSTETEKGTERGEGEGEEDKQRDSSEPADISV